MKRISILLLIALVGVSAPSGAERPPAGRTYFAIFLGLDADFGAGADCLRFSPTTVCASGGDCGTWTRTERAPGVGGIAFEFDFDEGGQRIRIDGQARLDGRGEKSTLAAAARMRAGGKPVNFGFLGRPASRRACLELLADWTRKNPPDQGERNAACVERARFGHPAESQYVLPYPVGVQYELSQSYCFAAGGHRNQLAYDFSTPVGSEVVAARAGTVQEVIEDQPDSGTETDPNVHNRVLIQHDDGTVAFYAHLLQNGVLVEAGQRVEAGQLLGYNGNSGNTGGFPHLHFGVYQSWPPQEGNDVPVNFSNALGPLDERGGLYRGVVYKALAPPDPAG
jgi:murein DD-endopeptidase MepM/ murein hydrolase activator NlpD